MAEAAQLWRGRPVFRVSAVNSENQSMKTTTKLILAAAIGLICAQPASAQPQSMAMPEGHGGMGHMGFMHGDSSPFMMLLKSANLTPSQHAQVQQILQADHAQMKPVTQQFHALHEQIAARLLGA